MKKILLTFGILFIGATALTAYASPMFDYSDGTVGLNVWNGIFQQNDTFKRGTGLYYALTDGDFTGGAIVVSGVAQSQIAGLVPRLNTLEATVSSQQFFIDFNNDQVNGFSSSLSGAIIQASGAIAAVNTVTGQIVTIQTLVANMNFSLTGALATINTITASISGFMNIATFNTLSSGFLVSASMSGIINNITADSGAIIALQNAGFSTGLVTFTGGAGSTRPFNTGFRVSLTGFTDVTYSIQLSMSVGLATPQDASVILEMADNQGFTVNVTELSRMGNSLSGIITSNNSIVPIGGVVPAGKWVRIRFVQNTGTSSSVSMPSFREATRQ